MEDKLQPAENQPTHSGHRPYRIRVHPSVVFKLGEDLITDDVQALVELAKNAYDADSSRVRIEILTDVWTDRRTGEAVEPEREHLAGVTPDTKNRDEAVDEAVSSVRSDPLRGTITITDYGTGMTLSEIDRGWLTVSASPKREMKANGLKTGGDRTPLGDKGLGRLGAQRLGEVLDLETVPNGGDSAYKITIPWNEFERASSLDEVKLSLSRVPRGDRPSGSRLRIRGLRTPERWLGDDLLDLQRELSAMISPFGNHGFEVSLSVNKDEIDLRSLPESVRRAAVVSYKLSYSNGTLHVLGRIATAFLRPQASGLPAFRELVEADNGVAFLNWILQDRPVKAGGIGLSHGDDRYFATVEQAFSLATLDGVSLQRGENGEEFVADPGPFSGEIDQVLLRDDATGTFGSTAEYRDYVRAINGVRVYRNGFGIRLEKDWLGLGTRWTSGKSFYSLRPENVIGFIDLTADGNEALVETTNREGFQDTPAYRNFKLALETWRAFTENAQTLLRRAYNDYLKQHLALTAAVEPTATPSSVVAKVRETVKANRQHSVRAQALSVSLNEVRVAVEDVRRDQERAADSLFPLAVSTDKIDASLRQIGSAMERAEALDHDLKQLGEQYAAQLSSLELLNHQIQLIEAQLSDAWEAVALGLAAEALSHEVHQVADRLRGRSVQLVRYLDERRIANTRVRAYIEHVRSSAAALNRQVSHLNPALRYMRERRQQILLSELLAEIQAYFADKWQPIQLRMNVIVDRDFVVEMNAGKLTQVFDNLVLNSEYWLREQQRRGLASEGVVEIRVRDPYVTLTDSGPGVDPAVEGLLFEPFVTTKGRGKGRGLGLFVVRQLLEAEGASIELDPDRGSDGRRRRFRITFLPSGVAGEVVRGAEGR